MRYSTYITNCASQIDLNKMIADIPADAGWYTPPSYNEWMDRMNQKVLPYIDNGNECLASVNCWKGANIAFEGITARNITTPDSVKEEFRKILGLDKILWAEISCIAPGKCLPHHADAWLPGWTELRARKFSCFVGEPNFGQVFVLNNEYFCEQPQGDIIEWHNPNEWHTGMNFGVHTKWLMNIIGTNLQS
jgi:hypothetical protein